MGLDINGTRCLLYAKARGVDFSRSAMIGRQDLYLRPADLKKNLTEFGLSADAETIYRVFHKNNGYAEEFLRYLGAKDVHSFDKSDYEGATHLHDMNYQMPPYFSQQYSVVLDGGSLEHVFNFPIAIKNCMEMVRVGGHYVGITPANNFMGHGFYQFSPELYFSVFSGVNGYELINVIAFEDEPLAKWFSVKSPTSVKRRVSLINSVPVYLFVIAKRIESIAIFTTTPQQSDYVSIWNQANVKVPLAEAHPSGKKRKPLKELKQRYISRPIRRLAKRLVGHGFNPRFFQPISPTDGIHMPNKPLQRTR